MTCETLSLEFSSQDPVRSAIVDSCIRVMDNGRESVNRKVLHSFGFSSVFDYVL